MLDHITSLGSFTTLDNLECNGVPFIQGFVSLAYDSRVVDKYIWTVIAPDEAVAFRMIKPFDGFTAPAQSCGSILDGALLICPPFILNGGESVGPDGGGN